MISQIDILKGARDLIADSAKWTQGTGARDANGSGVAPMSGEAVSWCAQGAIDRICTTYGRRSVPGGVWQALQGAARAEGFLTGIVAANDCGTHAQVVAIFDHAIMTMERDK